MFTHPPLRQRIPVKATGGQHRILLGEFGNGSIMGIFLPLVRVGLFLSPCLKPHCRRYGDLRLQLPSLSTSIHYILIRIYRPELS
jgi:hypothetical protein